MQTADWQGIEAKAAFHGVAPVVARVLLQNANDLVPEEVRQRSKDRITSLAQNNIQWLQEWKRLLQTFDEALIPVISFKGPALALTAYSNLGLREFHDLDLLIHPRNVARANDKLWARVTLCGRLLLGIQRSLAPVEEPPASLYKSGALYLRRSALGPTARNVFISTRRRTDVQLGALGAV